MFISRLTSAPPFRCLSDYDIRMPGLTAAEHKDVEATSIHFCDLPFDGVWNYISHLATHGLFIHLLTQQERKTTAKRCALFLLPPHLKVMAWLCTPLGWTASSNSLRSWGPLTLARPINSALPGTQDHLLFLIQRFDSQGLPALWKSGIDSNGLPHFSPTLGHGSLTLSQCQGSLWSQPPKSPSSPRFPLWRPDTALGQTVDWTNQNCALNGSTFEWDPLEPRERSMSFLRTSKCLVGQFQFYVPKQGQQFTTLRSNLASCLYL